MNRLIAAALLASVTAPAFAAPPVVLELFTSQSCSSCPPADALLNQIATQPGILALDFHVDYWNGIGWHDPFSAPEFTARQSRYAATLGSETYTPQLVVGGTRQMVGSDENAVTAAIAATRAAPATPTALLTQRTGDTITIDVPQGQGDAVLLLIGYDSHHVTNVGGGENAGRTLTETNVVRSLSQLGTWHGTALHTTTTLPKGEHAAILLQQANGQILAAAAAG